MRSIGIAELLFALGVLVLLVLGRKLIVRSRPAVTGSRQCPHCGQRVPDIGSFCPICGQKIV